MRGLRTDCAACRIERRSGDDPDLVTHRIDLGRRGERIAEDHLVRLGHRILDRNWRCRDGELDLVSTRDGVVVAVEVKTRSSLRAGHPFEAIHPEKLHRLHRLGARWCTEHGVPTRRLRVDVVGVLLAVGSAPVVEHLEGVV